MHDYVNKKPKKLTEINIKKGKASILKQLLTIIYITIIFVSSPLQKKKYEVFKNMSFKIHFLGFALYFGYGLKNSVKEVSAKMRGWTKIHHHYEAI